MIHRDRNSNEAPLMRPNNKYFKKAAVDKGWEKEGGKKISSTILKMNKGRHALPSNSTF